MRILIVLLLSFCIMSYAYADLYGVIAGVDPKGITSVTSEDLSDWEKDYTMIKVGEEYRGKCGYEIKWDGVKIRLATKQEIETHLQQKEDEREQREIQKWLDKLDDPAIKQKIKNL